MRPTRAGTSAFVNLVGLAPKVKRLAGGFAFVEGPIWNPAKGELLFNDIPASQRWSYTPQRGVKLISRSTNKANGMTYDAQLRLVVCEHSTNSVVRFASDGRREVLASQYGGLELNSPNDVVVTREGCILFTDPTFGRNERFGMERPIPRPERSVYCLAPSGDLRVVRDDFQEPNGLCLSPDGSVLYVNDSPRAEIRAFGWSRDHCTDEGAIFANRIGNGVFGEGIVDGMKADRAGNIWVTGPGGVWVFDPSGTHLGIVSVPEEVGNLHWGGDDFSDLYICATSSLYRLQTATSGAMEPFLHGLARGIAQQ